MLGILLLAETLAFQGAQPLAVLDDLFPEDQLLVKAEALMPSSFKITHVYVGNEASKGRQFTAELYVPRVLGIGMIILQEKIPVKPGEMGIWWLRITQGGKELTSLHAHGWKLPRFRHIGSYPALKDGSEEGERVFVRTLRNAEVLETIYRAGAKDRLKVIDNFVKTKDPEKGACALSTLVNSSDPKIVDYLSPLAADDSMPFRTQWEVDVVLLGKKQEWGNSKDRLRMLQRWFSGALKEKEETVRPRPIFL
jgi:hypothetical protein